MLYEKPELEIVILEVEDIVTASKDCHLIAVGGDNDEMDAQPCYTDL